MKPALPVVVALALAGCLAPASLLGDDAASEVPALLADWAQRALPFETPHNHSDAAQHVGLSTPNFEVLGHDPLETGFYSGAAGSYFCGEGAARADGRRIAYVNSFSSDVAFVGVDVTDPLRPTKVSEFALPNGRVYDVTATPDGRYVALGLNNDRAAVGPNPPGAQAPTPGLPAPGLACLRGDANATARDDTPYPGGVLLVDVSDPAQPRSLDFFPQPYLGVHSISSAEVDGRTLVLASITNLAHGASYFSFFEIVDGKLELRYTYRPPPESAGRAAVLNGHVDGSIQKHPITSQTLAYLADWDGGMVVLDVTDFASVEIVGRWSDSRFGVPAGGDTYTSDTGNAHGTLPMTSLWDGRHYTILGQEVASRPSDAPSGKIFILDTTDPANPTWVSSWTLPVDVPWSRSLLFSTHYPIVIEQTMFVPMYHGGLWAVDLADPSQPRTVGVYVPDRLSDLGASPRAKFAPAVLEAVPTDTGDLVLFEASSGAYALRFHRDVDLPAVAEWPVLEPAASR